MKNSITINDPKLILICAVKYIINEKTNLNLNIASELLHNWDALTDWDKEDIIKYLKESQMEKHIDSSWSVIIDKYNGELRKKSLYQNRCRHCSMLIENDAKEWFCDDINKKCSDIEECSFNDIH